MKNQIGDSISYDEMAEMDDRERDDYDRFLAACDLCRFDNGDGYVLAWKFARNGDRLDEPCRDAMQPESYDDQD